MRAFVSALGLAAISGALLSGCFAVRSPRGGGMTAAEEPRKPVAADVVLPKGYQIQAVAQGLTFPVSLTFDDRGNLYVVESGYVYGEVWTTPRLLKVEANGGVSTVASGTDNGPWNGVTFHEGRFYLAEGGERRGGRILEISPGGEVRTVLEGLPSMGDHHTNAAILHDDWIYFGQGTATNSGVVGEDNAGFGWLARHPEFHDIPCRDITLEGRNYTSKDQNGKEVQTGAFSAYGTPTRPWQKISGRIPCSGAILRVHRDGSDLQLVAWGLRNPFALAFGPDDQLYALDNSYDDRGSRPVHGTGDLMWRIEPGRWYGWPDYHGTRRLDDGDHFQPPLHDKPAPLLVNPPETPPPPLTFFGVHASANGMDFSRSEAFGFKGQVFVAEFGDQSPAVGKVLSPVGFKVVRVDLKDGTIEEFAVNRGKENGPASRLNTGGLERPVAVRFSLDGSALYIADFGVMTMDEKGAHPRPETGVIWRISRESVARSDE